MKTVRAYATAAAAVVLVASLLAAFAMVPAGSTQAAPSLAPTPVAAVQRSPAPEFPTFFNAKVLTADTRSSCFEVPDYAVIDLQYLIDQTLVESAANTTTLTLQFSNDLVTYVDGLNAVASNADDASGMVQLQLFGRHTCVYANVSNTLPVTITVNGVVK